MKPTPRRRCFKEPPHLMPPITKEIAQTLIWLYAELTFVLIVLGQIVNSSLDVAHRLLIVASGEFVHRAKS